MTLSGTGNLFLSGTLNNAGTITQVAPSSFNELFFNVGTGAVLNNSGLYDIQENGTALQTSGGFDSQAFNNLAGGTLQKSGPATAGTATNGGVHFSNLGTVIVKSGTLSLANVAQENIGTNTLTGGTWNVFTNSTLTFSSGSNLTTNNGNITLDGVNSLFANITNLNANNGSFTLKDGQGFAALSGGSFTNAGNVTIDATGGASALTAQPYNQTGGNTILIAGGTIISSKTATLSAGTLQGTGTITGSVINSGGTLEPGGELGSPGRGHHLDQRRLHAASRRQVSPQGRRHHRAGDELRSSTRRQHGQPRRID